MDSDKDLVRKTKEAIKKFYFFFLLSLWSLMEWILIGILVLFVLELYYVRFVALQWLRTDRSYPPIKFYWCVIISLLSSTFIVVWRVYVDYELVDPILMFSWFIIILAQAWWTYRVASQCPVALGTFTFLSKFKQSEPIIAEATSTDIGTRGTFVTEQKIAVN